ncbi:Prefoldin [Jimgerdemannia flammicorona]|uniref:Prefoldin n=1 Tax=Jimgerdemannia flammicorona TaxID=994334 RepID=A0A433R111_9FUNG|nr:Prefoldin [Jimgerdemannia flammicorona]
MAGQIELSDLELPQLQQVKQQLEEEFSHLTSSYGQLKQAQAKFADCLDSVDNLTPKNAVGSWIWSIDEFQRYKKHFASLTALNLYVPGQLADVDNVIVDIGTGYYVEKSTKDAIKFYKAKIEYVKGNVDKLQQAISGKQNNLRGEMGESLCIRSIGF